MKSVQSGEKNHVPDMRLVNKAELASWFVVSLTTVDQWLRRGLPYTQHGSRGVQWEFDLLEVAKWRYGSKTDEHEDNPDLMAPKERLDWYRGTRERTRHMEETKKLIPAATFESELARVLKVVAITLESLPDVLERDAGISGEAVDRVQAIADRHRNELHQRLTKPNELPAT